MKVVLNDSDLKLIKDISLKKHINLNVYDYNPDEIMTKLAPEIEDDDLILDLMSFIDDKKMEYGFNYDYSVNELGAKLTSLWDKIYYQHNK